MDTRPAHRRTNPPPRQDFPRLAPTRCCAPGRSGCKPRSVRRQARTGSDNAGTPWRQAAADAAADHGPASRSSKLNATLAKDPLLGTLDQLWNANPLREIVPVDWAEIARALRTVWLRSLARPEQSVAAAMELNARLLTTATEIWTDTLRRWWEGAAPAPPDGKPPPAPDKRFAAPEWHANPAYRTLKEAYLLASDWLLTPGRCSGPRRRGTSAPQFPPAPVRRCHEPDIAAADRTRRRCAGRWKPAAPAWPTACATCCTT